MICFIIDHFVAFRSTQTWSCFVLYLDFLAIQQLFFFTLEYYHLLCQECCENFTTAQQIPDIVILIAISIHFLVSVLFLTIIPTNGLWGVKFKTSSNPIACKLMNDSFILSLLLIESSFKHWSCYLVQISGCTLLSLLNCVYFPREYIIISFDLTNVISLFT